MPLVSLPPRSIVQSLHRTVPNPERPRRIGRTAPVPCLSLCLLAERAAWGTSPLSPLSHQNEPACMRVCGGLTACFENAATHSRLAPLSRIFVDVIAARRSRALRHRESLTPVPASFVVPGRAHAPHRTPFGVRCCESRRAARRRCPALPLARPSRRPTTSPSATTPSPFRPPPPPFLLTLQRQLSRRLNQHSWLRVLAHSKQLRGSKSEYARSPPSLPSHHISIRSSTTPTDEENNPSYGPSAARR